MKKVSILVLSVLLTSYSLAIAHTGNFEIDNLGIIPNESEKLEVAEHPVIPLEPAYGMDDSQRSAELGFFKSPLLSSLPRNLGESGFCFDSFMGFYSATPVNPVKLDGPVQFDYGNGGLPQSHILDVFGQGGSPLFITRSITNRWNSVPESSTMILLGLGLIGLAGYGGRKKFKR